MYQAMIFAAGLGSRLRPLTDNCPKPLIEVNGKPLIAFVLNRLIKAGVSEIGVNVHYLPDKMIAWLENYSQQQGLKIKISDERQNLLDTGGGLKAALPLFDKNRPLFICNADILTHLDLNALLAHHKLHQAFATLAVQDRPSGRKLLFTPNGYLAGWQNTKTGETRIVRKNTGPLTALAFSGQQVVAASFLHTAPEGDIFSIIDWYLGLAEEKRILAFRHDQDAWMDVGTPAMVLEAEKIFGV